MAPRPQKKRPGRGRSAPQEALSVSPERSILISSRRVSCQAPPDSVLPQAPTGGGAFLADLRELGGREVLGPSFAPPFAALPAESDRVRILRHDRSMPERSASVKVILLGNA